MPRQHIHRIDQVPSMQRDDDVHFLTPLGAYIYTVANNHLSVRSFPQSQHRRNRAVLLEMLGLSSDDPEANRVIHEWALQFLPEGSEISTTCDWPVVPTGLPSPGIEYLRLQVAAIYRWIDGIEGFVRPSDWRVDIEAINEEVLDGGDYQVVLKKYAEKHGLISSSGDSFHHFPEYSRLMSHVQLQINAVPKPPR